MNAILRKVLACMLVAVLLLTSVTASWAEDLSTEDDVYVDTTEEITEDVVEASELTDSEIDVEEDIPPVLTDETEEPAAEEERICCGYADLAGDMEIFEDKTLQTKLGTLSGTVYVFERIETENARRDPLHIAYCVEREMNTA